MLHLYIFFPLFTNANFNVGILPHYTSSLEEICDGSNIHLENFGHSSYTETTYLMKIDT